MGVGSKPPIVSKPHTSRPLYSPLFSRQRSSVSLESLSLPPSTPPPLKQHAPPPPQPSNDLAGLDGDSGLSELAKEGRDSAGTGSGAGAREWPIRGMGRALASGRYDRKPPIEEKSDSDGSTSSPSPILPPPPGWYERGLLIEKKSDGSEPSDSPTHADHVAPALYLYPLNDSFVPKHIALLPQRRVRIGRQINMKTVPAERNGYFDSKSLSRQHAEVWEQDGRVINLLLLSRGHEDNPALQIYIKDVKSTNGTVINGERLSPEGIESEPFELKSEDIAVSRFHPFPALYTVTYGTHIQLGIGHRHRRRRLQNHHPPQGRCPCSLCPQRAGRSSRCPCGATTTCPESTRLRPFEPPPKHDFGRWSQ